MARETFDVGAALFELERAETAPEAPVEPALKKVSLGGLERAELAPPEFAFEQIVPRNEVTLLGGHGGTGKSLFALTLAAHYAASKPWFGLWPQDDKAVYISLEDPASVMIYRLKKICQVYDLPLEKVIENLTIFDGSDADGALCVETSEYGVRSIKETPLFEEVRAACHSAGFIIIDNASDAYAANENVRAQVRLFIRALRRLSNNSRAGLLLLAHVDKQAARNGAQGNTYSGSTAWHNSVRSRLALTEKNGTFEFVQEKLNIGKKLERPIPLTWTGGVLIPGMDIEGVTDVEGENKAAVLTAVQKAIADGVTVPTARTGPANCQNTLERLPDLPGYLKGRKGRDVFYKALAELQREGALQVEEYQTPARHTRQRFVCAGSDALHIIPNTLRAEPAKPAREPALVQRVAPITGTGETGETGAEEDLLL